MKNALLLAGATSLALVGCSDTTPQMGDKAKAGAAAGALVGLISGITTDDDSNGKIKRAVVGAAIGGLIGNELDKQEAELRDELGGSGALITNTGNELIVTLPEAITFDTDSTFVRPSLQNSLVQLAQNLNRYPNSGVDVIGHTDNVGDASYNQNLSARRADAVSAILTSAGVDFSRIRSYGRGETQPIATNNTIQGRAMNRRVEIVITPTG